MAVNLTPEALANAMPNFVRNFLQSNYRDMKVDNASPSSYTMGTSAYISGRGVQIKINQGVGFNQALTGSIVHEYGHLAVAR